MEREMNIQWYPGHMTKTRRQIEADLKQAPDHLPEPDGSGGSQRNQEMERIF